MTSKSWCYTLNNPTKQDIDQFKAFECNRHRCALEKGESGTPHLQGVITFKKSYRLSGLKKLNNNAHWEVCKDLDKAINYCTKGEVLIDTANGQQGARSDLSEAVETALSRGMIGLAEEHPVTYIRYHKGIQSLINRLNSKKKNFQEVKVIIIYGKAGKGKSRMAREIDPDLYNVPEPTNGNVWFDEYDGEKTVLFDDYYGWFKYHTLLQLLDGYPMKLQIKGGFVSKLWDKVIITSNKPWEEWYRERDEGFAALDRRITHIYNIDTEQWERGEPVPC